MEKFQIVCAFAFSLSFSTAVSAGPICEKSLLHRVENVLRDHIDVLVQEAAAEMRRLDEQEKALLAERDALMASRAVAKADVKALEQKIALARTTELFTAPEFLILVETIHQKTEARNQVLANLATEKANREKMSQRAIELKQEIAKGDDESVQNYSVSRQLAGAFSSRKKREILAEGERLLSLLRQKNQDLAALRAKDRIAQQRVEDNAKKPDKLAREIAALNEKMLGLRKTAPAESVGLQTLEAELKLTSEKVSNLKAEISLRKTQLANLKMNLEAAGNAFLGFVDRREKFRTQDPAPEDFEVLLTEFKQSHPEAKAWVDDFIYFRWLTKMKKERTVRFFALGNGISEPSIEDMAVMKAAIENRLMRNMRLFYDADSKAAPFIRGLAGDRAVGITAKARAPEEMEESRIVPIENPYLRAVLFNEAITIFTSDSLVGIGNLFQRSENGPASFLRSDRPGEDYFGALMRWANDAKVKNVTPGPFNQILPHQNFVGEKTETMPFPIPYPAQKASIDAGKLGLERTH